MLLSEAKGGWNNAMIQMDITINRIDSYNFQNRKIELKKKRG